MDKLIKAIAASNTEQKTSLLPQLIEHDESGIDYLLECLEDSEIKVRAKAYEFLQGVESEKVSKAIASGLLFNPGDYIYSIYKAGRWFTDESYIYFDRIDYLLSIKKRFKAYELLKGFNTPEAKKAIARGIDDIEVKSIYDLGDEIELNSIRNSWDGNPT